MINLGGTSETYEVHLEVSITRSSRIFTVSQVYPKQKQQNTTVECLWIPQHYLWYTIKHYC